MYAGKFNLNIWLRQFVRRDLVDAYEKECLALVQAHAGVDKQALPELIEKLNGKLTEMINHALEIRRKEDAGEEIHAFISKELIEEIGYEAAIDRLRGEMILAMPGVNPDRYESTMTHGEDGIRWVARQVPPITELE